jgi:hypothetical protein
VSEDSARQQKKLNMERRDAASSIQRQRELALEDSARKQKKLNMERHAAASSAQRQRELAQQDSAHKQKARNIEQERLKLESSHPIGNKITESPTDKSGKRKRRSDTVNHEAQMQSLINDLVQNKVVADASAVESIGLREDQLVVNGQKAAEDVHQKMKVKYGIRPGYGLYYGQTTIHGPGIIIDKKN